MSLGNWKDDPLVKVQDVVWPVMWLTVNLLLKARFPESIPKEELEFFPNAAIMLRTTGPELMRDYGVPITAADEAVFAEAAEQVIVCHHALTKLLDGPFDPKQAEEIWGIIHNRVQPALSIAIDRYRMAFITLIIERQRANAQQAITAISGLDRISKTIFHISINASVEAARAGDAGRGFLQISSDIRALSQSARDATRDLSNLVATNGQMVKLPKGKRSNPALTILTSR